MKNARTRPLFPGAYDVFQCLLGRRSAGGIFVREHLRPKDGERLLDLGCGTGKILEFLPSTDYWGLDLDEGRIASARAVYGERAHFFHADLRDEPWPVEGAFDRVMAVGVLHHLSDTEVVKVLRRAKSRMKPGAKLVTLDGCYEKGQPWMARLLLSLDRGRFVRTRDAYAALALEVFGDVRLRTERRLLLLPYTHLVMEMSA